MNRPTARPRTSFGDAARPPTVALVAVLVGAAYLWWRSSTLGSGWLLVLSVPFFAVEAWAFVELALLTIQTWRIPPAAPRAEVGRDTEPIDIAIVAAGRDIEDLERTLLACRNVRSRGRLIVIDDERRFRHRSVAANAGASYRIDKRAIEAPGLAAYRSTDADTYLWLRSGQLPMPDLIEVIGPRFKREDLAVCQLATSLLNSSDLAHLGRERDDDDLINQVVGPALSRWDAGLWLGSASVVRRSAIEQIGGFDRHVPIERLTARLHRAGWATAFERRHLVATTAPEAIERYLAVRRQRAGAALSVLLSREGPLMPGGSMGLRRRLAHLGAAARFGTGLRLLTLSMVMVAVLLTGRFPIDGSLLALTAFGGGSALLGSIGRGAVARGSMGRGDWLHQGWRVVGAEAGALIDAITGRVRPAVQERNTTGATGGLAALAHLPLLDAIVLVLDLALLVRAFTIIDRNALPAFDTGQRVLAIGFAVTMLVPIVRVMQVTVARQQRRSHHRIPVVLEATVDGTPANTTDITPSGAGILLPFKPSIGVTTSLELAIPGADGVERRIVGQAVVRSAREGDRGQWRVGLELQQMAPAARQALASFYALQPVPDEVDDSPAPVVDPAVAAEQRRRRSVRRATVGAGLAGLATIVFGPGIASASTADPALVQQICVVGADDTPVGDVRVERLVGDSVQVLGATDLIGCVDTGADAATTGYALTHRGARYELQPGDYQGVLARVALAAWEIRVVDLDGEPVPEAEVRFFTDRWLPTVAPAEPDAGARFEGLPVESATQQVEIRLDGVRYVRAVGDRTSTTVVLSRVRFLPRTADEVPPVLDRGVGWEPLVDSAPLVPGPLVVRLADGEILRLEVPESHELILPDGVLVPVELDLPDLVEPEPEPTTSTTVDPSTGDESPTSDSTTPPTVGSNQSTTSSTSPSSSTTAPSSTASSSTSSPSTEPGQTETDVDASTSTTVAESDPAPTTSTTEPGATEPTDPSTTVPAVDASTSSSEVSDP
ncbi:MAG: PilZ domain-containing protein [Actinomycetota bacterium]